MYPLHIVINRKAKGNRLAILLCFRMENGQTKTSAFDIQPIPKLFIERYGARKVDACRCQLFQMDAVQVAQQLFNVGQPPFIAKRFGQGDGGLIGRTGRLIVACGFLQNAL